MALLKGTQGVQASRLIIGYELGLRNLGSGTQYFRTALDLGGCWNIGLMDLYDCCGAGGPLTYWFLVGKNGMYFMGIMSGLFRTCWV